MLNMTAYWYRQSYHFSTIFLLPFAFIFRACIAIRRWLYRTGKLKTYRIPVPVIVVGNITVGGTGKTPFVIWLANFLQSQGYHPGIVSRGVGGKKQKQAHWVNSNDSAAVVGDEALLLQQTGCPVVIGVDRVAAAFDLLQRTSCDIIISDDGLQHYRLERNIEIVMVDGMRRFGNQYLLPAGPLREPVPRLQEVDFVIVNGGTANDPFTMTLQPSLLMPLYNAQPIELSAFPQRKVHAVAGIGNPQRFFHLLQEAGFEIIPHVFPDHHLFCVHDIDFSDALPIIMTEKDAVKCKAFANERCWYLPVTAKIETKLEIKLIKKIAAETGVTYDAEEDFTLFSCHAHLRQHSRHRCENNT